MPPYTDASYTLGKPFRCDGKLSSRILVAALVPVLLVVVVVVSLRSKLNHTYSLEGLTIIDILAGISAMFMILLLCLTSKFGNSLLRRRNTESFSHTPKLFFTWIFGVAMIGWCGLKMVQRIEESANKTNNIPMGTAVFLGVTEIATLCTQLIFLTKFSKYVFTSTVLVNFGMSVMVTTHFSGWFHGILVSFFRHHVMTFQHHVLTNQTTVFNSSQSDFTKLMRSVDSLITVRTEYNLLAVGFLLRMWDKEFPSTTSEPLDDLHNFLYPTKRTIATQTRTSRIKKVISNRIKIVIFP